jgi:hypothetical protein
MIITIKPGRAWINGYFYYNTSDLNITLDNADGALKRIDRLILRLDFQQRTIKAAVKKGQFASSPTAPALQRNADAYEICLGDVTINAGVTTITQSVIADKRTDTSLCGLVTGTINQIDATNLFAQYDAAFMEWFNSARDILSGDIAGNLLSLIQALEAWKNKFGVLLWSGSVGSGTIAVPGLQDYTEYRTTVNNAGGRIFISRIGVSDTVFRGNGLAMGGHQQLMLDATVSGNYLTINTCGYMTHIPSGNHSAFTASNLLQIYGLF